MSQMRRGRRRYQVRVVLSALCAGAIATVAAACGASSGSNSAGTFSLAVMTPTVGPGAVLGKPLRQGVSMAVSDINKQGGIGHRKVKATFYDLGETADTALTATRQAISAKPDAIVGYPISTQGVAVKPVLDRAGIPTIYTGSNDGVLGGGKSFGILPDDALAVSGLAQFATTTLHKMKAAVMYSNNDYGVGGLNTFKTVYGRLGGKVVLAEPHAFDATNLVPQMSKVPGSGADVIVTITTIGQSMAALRARAQLGITLPTVNPPILPSVLRTAPASVSNGEYAFIGSIPQQSSNPATVAWAKRFAATNGSPADEYSALGYDSVGLFGAAVKKTSGVSPDDIAKGLSEIHGYTGMYGTYSADSHGRLVQQGIVAQAQNYSYTDPVLVKQPDLSGLTIDGVKF